MSDYLVDDLSTRRAGSQLRTGPLFQRRFGGQLSRGSKRSSTLGTGRRPVADLPAAIRTRDESYRFLLTQLDH